MDINLLLDEYRADLKKFNQLYDDMNNYMQPLSEIHRKQRVFLDFEDYLKKELYGEFVEYQKINRKGICTVEKKKVRDGKYEPCVPYLSKRELV